MIRSVVICTNWSMNLSSGIFKLSIETVSTADGLQAIHSIKLVRFWSPDISSKARINCDPVTPSCMSRDRTSHRIWWRWFLMHRKPVSDDWSVRGIPCSGFPFALDRHIGREDRFCSSFDARNRWSRTRCWNIRYRCWAIIAERMLNEKEKGSRSSKTKLSAEFVRVLANSSLCRLEYFFRRKKKSRRSPLLSNGERKQKTKW